MVSPFVTGFIGWLSGGPVGGLIGAGLGILWNHITAAASQQQQPDRPPPPPPPPHSRYRPRPQSQAYANPADPADFAVSFMVLVAAVMKADGRATRDELDVVKRYLSDHYPSAIAQDALHALRDLLKEDIDVRPVCARIAARFAAPARRQLLHMLFSVAYADNICTPEELTLLLEIGTKLRLSRTDILSIAAMFGLRPGASSSGGQRARPSRDAPPPIENDYAILGIPPSASDQDVKKAYRRMAQKHHPDKVAHLGPAAQSQATQKFLSIQQAYDRIRAARHL